MTFYEKVNNTKKFDIITSASRFMISIFLKVYKIVFKAMGSDMMVICKHFEQNKGNFHKGVEKHYLGPRF